MKGIITILSVLLFIGCQNQSETNTGKSSNITGTLAVDEKSLIALGGEKQYVEIKGVSVKNPVLLFLHGGPGWPQTPHLRYFNQELTKSMTVVAWEQSGCGKSYMNNPDPEKLSLDQIINDAHELTQILKEKFNKDRIYLAGFSWGSIIGLRLVEKFPEDYSAYFGISQVINVNKNIQLSREWIKEQAVLKNDTASLTLLSRIEKKDTGICKGRLDCFLKHHEVLGKFGGAVYRKESAAEIQKAETHYDDYKNYNWFDAFMYSATRLENDLFEADLSTIKEVKIPVYFFAGRRDWNIPPAAISEFYQNLKAPEKELIWFENSGHELSSEEADFFNKNLAARVTR